MKKPVILLAILVLPVSIFMFLKIFGRNEYKALPIFVPDNVEGCDLHTALSLLSYDSTAINSKTLEGSIWVIALHGLGNDEVSADIGRGMVRAQERFAGREEVKLLSMVVEADSLPALMTYAQRYDAQRGKWLLGTGTEGDMKPFTRCVLALQTKSEGLVPDKMLVLLDKKSRVRGYFDASNREEVDRLLTEIPLLLREYENKK